MRILIAGDVHGRPQVAESVALANDCDAMILVGDISDIVNPRNLPTYMVAGNHENFEWWNIALHRGPDKWPENVHILDYYDEFVLDGVNFGVIGKIDRDSHLHLKREIPWLWQALGPKPSIWMERGPVEDIFGSDIDVLLTHDAPFPMVFSNTHSGEYIEHTAGSSYLTRVVEHYQPSLHFGGHFHAYHQRVIGDTVCTNLDEVYTLCDPARSYAILDTETMEVTHAIA